MDPRSPSMKASPTSLPAMHMAVVSSSHAESTKLEQNPTSFQSPDMKMDMPPISTTAASPPMKKEPSSPAAFSATSPPMKAPIAATDSQEQHDAMSPLHLPAPRHAALNYNKNNNNNNDDNAAPFASAPNLPPHNSTSRPTTSPQKLEKMSDASRSISACMWLILCNAALSLFALYTISTFVPWSWRWARATPTHHPTPQVPCLAPVKEYASVRSMEEDPSHWLLRQFPEHEDMAACTNAATWCPLLPSASNSSSSTTNVLMNSAILAKGCASMEPFLLRNMHPALVINHHHTTSSAVPSAGFDWTHIGSSDHELLRVWTALLAPDSLLPSNPQKQQPNHLITALAQCERAILQAMRGLLWCEEFRFGA